MGFARLALSLHLENIGTLTIMINRELIRLKVVQLVYSYYQNEGKTIDMAEKELNFSLQKAYDLYQYLLSLLVELKKHAERKDAVRVARENVLVPQLVAYHPTSSLPTTSCFASWTTTKL